MGLQDVSSRDAITAAIAEFDRIGQAAFLEKYGFGEARSYLLRYDGKNYDSKAILGAAHGYQHGEPLSAADFSGGDRTVARRLEGLGFEVVRGQVKNPDWNRDELIVALCFYLEHSGKPPDQQSDKIAELSQFLNTLRQSLGTPANEKLRNPNGVYMKLMNFLYYDSGGSRGLANGGKLAEEVWKLHHADVPRLRELADAIRQGLRDRASEQPTNLRSHQEDGSHQEDEGELSGLEEADEGRILSLLHLRRERSPKLAQAKKARVLHTTGKLACEVCMFEFKAVYGDRGAGFIECHHLKPLASLPGIKTIRLVDLALLCANCHRMVHVRRPWLDLKALRAIRRAANAGLGNPAKVDTFRPVRD
jgi:5-methylcytosine-specific restriction protein A